MPITQTIGTIRTLSDAPNPLTDKQEVFDEKGYAYTLSQKNVNDDMKERVTELNTAFGQVNEVAVEVNDAKEATISAKQAAELARDEAVGAVATLPDGIINNGTVSQTDTWSSSKIDSTKANTNNPTLTGLKETSVAMGANDINLATGNLFTKTITGATTLTVSNIPTSGTVGYFILQLTNGGSATVTWFSGVKWAGGTAPTLTASGKDILSFYTIDAGTTWNIVSIQKDVK